MNFRPYEFVASLKYLCVGMIGIFLVMGVIILATIILNKVFKEKTDKE